MPTIPCSNADHNLRERVSIYCASLQISCRLGKHSVPHANIETIEDTLSLTTTCCKLRKECILNHISLHSGCSGGKNDSEWKQWQSKFANSFLNKLIQDMFRPRRVTIQDSVFRTGVGSSGYVQATSGPRICSGPVGSPFRIQY